MRLKYFENFVNYLNESNEDITDLSKEELDELLIPMIDLGIEYSFTTPRVITEGEFVGYKSLNIQFKNTFELLIDNSLLDIPSKYIVDGNLEIGKLFTIELNDGRCLFLMSNNSLVFGEFTDIWEYK